MKRDEKRKDLFSFLISKKEDEGFTLKEMQEASGYKNIGTMRTVKNNKLINVFIKEKEISKEIFQIRNSMKKISLNDFLEKTAEKKKETKTITIADHLIENSKNSILSAIELHNKPNFNYRYEIVIVLIISAWEKLLKAHILNFEKDDLNWKKEEVPEDWVEKKTVLELIGKIKTNQKNPIENIKIIGENIKQLILYRNDIIHFYLVKIDPLIFSLIFKNIIFYFDYLNKYFDIDLKKDNNLFLLPLGLKNDNEQDLKQILEKEYDNPIVQKYIGEIKKITSSLKEESIFVDYKISIDKTGKKISKLYSF